MMMVSMVVYCNSVDGLYGCQIEKLDAVCLCFCLTHKRKVTTDSLVILRAFTLCTLQVSYLRKQ